ncbi:MAG: proline dehydrogenase family protein [Bacteroidales bacterium]|nr:proline dehydrogenase family protein [Bacteroidales bacterium]
MINQIAVKVLPYLPESFVWLFSERYVAGKSLADAINECKKLNNEGVMVTLDVLGEFITSLDEAEKNKQEYLKVIAEAEANGIKGNYSLKPTMFGLLLDTEVCYKHIREIVAYAAGFNNFVRVDMEDSQCTDMEIELFRKLKKEFPANTGLVLQAYLKRTKDDIKNMLDLKQLNGLLNYRLCKGIYVEPKEIAYKTDADIHQHYLDDLEYMFANGIFAAIATHHIELVEGAYKLIEKYKVPKDMYEFQMLLGVTPKLRKSIVDKGHRMRVYVPFGIKWFAYCSRRLKENPKMATMIIKALFLRK